MEYIIEFLISLIVPLIILIKPLKKIIIEKEKIKEYKYEFLFSIILFVGEIARLFAISSFPKGFNPDEASSGYEAWSILNFGIDRNLKSFPVFLISWGSGQNALYTYLLIPFIKIFGLTEFATRLPMAIIGIVSIIVIYYLFKEISNKKTALIGALFLAICPWHIMKSRFGLESNIFPDIVLYAILFLIYFIKRNEIKYLYISFAILGISAYAYGISYFFLPFFVIPMLAYLIINKKVNMKNAIVAILILAIIAMPIILMVIINKFDLPEIKLGVFTIPRLVSNRFEEESTIFSNNFIQNSFNNFKESIKIVLLQKDDLAFNAMPFFGVFYIFSIPFTILGMFYCFKKGQKIEYKVINFWFVSAFLLLFVIAPPSIIRINIIWLPLILYTIIGLDFAFYEKQKILYCIVAIYLITFIIFEIKYFREEYNNETFVKDVKNVIQYLDKKKEKIYMEYCFKEPYIFVMFYNKIEPRTEKIVKNEKGVFNNIRTLGNFNFYIPKNIENGNIYVLNKKNNLEINKDLYSVKKIDDFFVYEPKNGG